MSNIFFTSDHHFHHVNIIKYCNRPYSTVHEMNMDYMLKWNQIITNNDVVYYLGDFSFGNPNMIKELFNQLNGKIKILIKGNHDRYNSRFAVENIGFNEVHGQLKFEEFLLSHRPNHDYKDKHLCGHVHKKWKFNHTFNILNVGVDIWNGYPISLETIRDEFSKVGTT